MTATHLIEVSCGLRAPNAYVLILNLVREGCFHCDEEHSEMKANLTSVGHKPEWLTFDCYGTLIQWDEGLLAAVTTILSKQRKETVDAKDLIHIYDKYEHEREQSKPHKSFSTVAGQALRMAMEQFGLAYASSDIELLTSGISRMPPFPEVVEALGELRTQGFRLCIISNTDDDVIAGNVAQMGGHIDRVITAQQAQAYKPSVPHF